MMKLFSILPLLLFFSLQVSAQNQNDTSQLSIEKSIYGIQTGFLGTWLYNESRLSNEFALRSQVGFDFRIEGVGRFEFAGPNDGIYGILHLSLEPRWYYNLEKRLKKGKSIDRNSGNFLSLYILGNFDDISFTSNDRLRSVDQVSIIPKWGIRRNIGSHFNFEAGIGFGYVRYINGTALNNQGGIFASGFKGNFTADIHLRIGLDL